MLSCANGPLLNRQPKQYKMKSLFFPVIPEKKKIITSIHSLPLLPCAWARSLGRWHQRCRHLLPTPATARLVGTHVASALCTLVCKVLPAARVLASLLPSICALVSVCHHFARKRAPWETHSIFFL